MDRNTGRSRGFGHLDFETEEDAATALKSWQEPNWREDNWCGCRSTERG